MKKMLLSLALLSAMVTPVFAMTQQDVTASQRVHRIGTKIAKANNLQHRYIYDILGSFQEDALPVVFDYSTAHDLNLHNNRRVYITANDYLKMVSDDEIAAILAHNLAQGEHSYTGVLDGQFFFTKNGRFPFNYFAKKNELEFDKTAVTYMKKAGYNPNALITAYEKTLPEWRCTFFGRHNKTAKRIDVIKKAISGK